MKTVRLDTLSLDTATAIAQRAIAHARERQMAPIGVAVLDIRGTLKVFLAEDGTSLLRQEIAFGKAWGALGMGHGGRMLQQRSANTPLFYNALQAMSGGKVVTVPGSVLVRDQAGQLLGAVGISGESSDNDERCAVAGIQAAGLVADTGAAP